jgi:hypothetical protein
MLTRRIACMFLLLIITFLTGCAGNKTNLEVEISENRCSGLSFINESGDKSNQNAKEIQTGTVEISIVNKGPERKLILIASQDFSSIENLPTNIINLGFTDGFQPVVNTDALTKDQLLVTRSIAKDANESIEVKLKQGSYWLLDPERIFCEEPLVLNVVP